MALKPCKECKTMVSNKAKVCPNCGVQKPVKRSAKWVWVVLGIIALIVLFGPSNDSSIKNANSTGSGTPQSSESTVEQATKQIETAMQDQGKFV